MEERTNQIYWSPDPGAIFAPLVTAAAVGVNIHFVSTPTAVALTSGAKMAGNT